MVQTMSQGLYSMSTVVQGEKLGQFLENEFPSMDDLKVSCPLLAAAITISILPVCGARWIALTAEHVCTVRLR